MPTRNIDTTVLMLQLTSVNFMDSLEPELFPTGLFIGAPKRTHMHGRIQKCNFGTATVATGYM